MAPDAHDGQPNPGPQQHAVLRLLGRLGNVLQGRPIRRLAANQARRIGNMISSNIGKLPLQLSAWCVLRMFARSLPCARRLQSCCIKLVLLPQP